MAYDQDRWAERAHYARQDALAALETFRWLRESTYRLIRELPESAFSATVLHPENGVMTFDDWLVIYEEHVRKHIGQMQRNYDAWLSRQRVTN